MKKKKYCTYNFYICISLFGSHPSHLHGRLYSRTRLCSILKKVCKYLLSIYKRMEGCAPPSDSEASKSVKTRSRRTHIRRGGLTKKCIRLLNFPFFHFFA